MKIDVTTTSPSAVSADWLILPVQEDGELTGPAAVVDEALSGQLSRLKEEGDFTGKLAEVLSIPDVPALSAGRLLLVGLGKSAEFTLPRYEKACRTAARTISEKKAVSVVLAIPDNLPSAFPVEAVCEKSATALRVGCVGQGLYQATPSRYEFTEATVLVPPAAPSAQVAAAIREGTILGEAVNLTRELVNRMADEIFPASFAERAEREAAAAGLTCRVLDEHQMKEEKMCSLLAVAIGSDRPPRLLVLEYRGAGENAPLLGLVGKGVTFDSGGLSLKSTENMKTMKGDMAGAATVLGALTAIARLKLPVNVIGFAGLVENMISGSSYKLGDVLKARNGVTIEVMNTDAEGRLVLADVLSYAVDQNVDRLIDLATLTGSCVVALGEDYTGVFTNNQPWCDEVLSAARTAGEKVWQLPTDDDFSELLKSDVADCKNVGPRWGGAITAAKFLEKFVGGKPWVHLDIAGPAFASSSKAHQEGGATGCMVRTLVETARQWGASRQEETT